MKDQGQPNIPTIPISKESMDEMADEVSSLRRLLEAVEGDSTLEFKLTLAPSPEIISGFKTLAVILKPIISDFISTVDELLDTVRKHTLAKIKGEFLLQRLTQDREVEQKKQVEFQKEMQKQQRKDQKAQAKEFAKLKAQAEAQVFKDKS